MKLTKVNNTNLSIVEIGNIKIAFSYKTPVAIMICESIFITDESFSKTTAKHKNEIIDLWDADLSNDYIDEGTFKSLLKAIEDDISVMMENKKPYIEQLKNLS